MPQPTPVRLHIQHLVARFEGGRPRLELETWTISVGSNYMKTIPNPVPATVYERMSVRAMLSIHMGWQVQGTREEVSD